MAPNRTGVKKGALVALSDARRARAEAEAREAEARQIAAQELGLSLLKTDAGEADPAALEAIVAAVIGLGSEAALSRLTAGQSGEQPRS
ncbi:MAG TPA: DUF6437 family protein [Pedomonas sp.]|uniref:DUF6437 family protein n=1 Tax=Pedomonas sp. TaxID=2976421 RepID=UPI002F3EFE7B